MPSSLAMPTSRSMTFWPVTESSEPVGSSAKTTCGCATSALAMATRWAWPPDSSPGAPAAQVVQAQPVQPQSACR